MSNTRLFRQQHDELLSLAGDISNQLNDACLESKAKELHASMSTFMGQLRVHLELENRELYPQLLEHTDPTMREVAHKFIGELDVVGKVVEQHITNWSSAESIRSAPRDFKLETKSLFKALAARIRKENSILYNTVDSL